MARREELFLPRPVAYGRDGGVRLQVVDFVLIEDTTDPAPASEVGTVITDTVEPGFYWRVERLVVSSSAGFPRCSVYGCSPTPTPTARSLRDYTQFGSAQVAEYPTGLLFVPNTAVIVQWEGLPEGETGTVSIQYQLVARQGG